MVGTDFGVATLKDVIFDCAHPAALARFWAAVLDGYEIAPYDDVERARLRSLGIDDVEDDPTVLVQAPSGGPRLWFQQVPERKVAKNRVHLDITCTDRHREAARLIDLGGRVIDQHPDQRRIVFADPEGNEFCLEDDAPASSS